MVGIFMQPAEAPSLPSRLQKPAQECTVMASGQQVLPEAKQIVNRTVHRQKVLCVARRFEPAHVAFPLASRLMRDFGAVVKARALAVESVKESGR